ncbi:hypothetical protein C2845_PM01G26500 [Panicum miliaceum]|uniref:Uncharacterized protein n=1 Tax=Panicum miliaceum TaxID=4540 RepID=A0A3L6TPX9_PANMI|nr:hypothetical protein C2845_PM01G26500 [Panicum miliaceum]
MSPAKRRHVRASDGTTVEPLPPPPPPPVPVDLLLEIFARLDVATIIRCAATSKTVRRAILDSPAAFGRRVEANGALLLGVSYAFLDSRYLNAVSSVGQAPRQNLRFDAGVLMSAEPVASRGGLTVLRHRLNYHHVRVCNALTGRASWLPPSHVSGDYPHALLAVDDAGRSFQLLVADVSLRTQVFSSDAGQ